MRSSRVRIAMICRAYSLGHVTAACRNGGEVDTQLVSQPADSGLLDPSRLAVLHAVFLVVPGTAFDPQIIIVTVEIRRQVSLEQTLFAHAGDELGAGQAEMSSCLGEGTFHVAHLKPRVQQEWPLQQFG